MIGDVLLECELGAGARRRVAGFENHAGRTLLDPGATPLGRVVAGYGNDGDSGFEGCRVGARDRHLPARAAAAAEPVARRLAARSGARARAAASGALEPLPTSSSASRTPSPRSGRATAAAAERLRLDEPRAQRSRAERP